MPQNSCNCSRDDQIKKAAYRLAKIEVSTAHGHSEFESSRAFLDAVNERKEEYIKKIHAIISDESLTPPSSLHDWKILVNNTPEGTSQDDSFANEDAIKSNNNLAEDT